MTLPAFPSLPPLRSFLWLLFLLCVAPDVADDAAPAFEALCGAIAASVAGHPSNQNTIARFQTSSETGVDGTAGTSATIAKLVRLVTAHTGGGGGGDDCGGGPFGGVEHGEAGGSGSGSGSGGLGVPTVVSASDAAIRCLAACVQEHPTNQMVSHKTPHARAHTPAPAPSLSNGRITGLHSAWWGGRTADLARGATSTIIS